METANTHSDPVTPAKGNGSAASAPVTADEVSEALAQGTPGATDDTELVQDAPRDGKAPDRAEATSASKAPNGATAVNVLTSAIGLMMASPRHRHLFLADLEWALLPPLALKQFRLFTKDGRPVALATWAFVSEEVAERLEAGQMKLKPADWRSGDKCWIVDLVAPYGAATEFVSVLRDSVLKDHAVSVPVLDPKTGERRVRNLETSA